MSNRKNDDESKENEALQELADGYVNNLKMPVIAQLATLSQVVPNSIDKLINDCMILSKQVNELTKERTKLLQELAVNKAKDLNKKATSSVKKSKK